MNRANAIAKGLVNRSAADVYDEFFVPALFAGWAAPVVDAANVTPGQHALDVACGTGVLTRELAARVGSRGSTFGVDINEDMLAVARRNHPGIEWRPGNAESLPFADDTFDAVCSQFGLMFFDDRERSVNEMSRVAKPGATMAVAVWDRLENTPGYAAAAALLERLFGAGIAESLRRPYDLGDVAALAALFDDSAVEDVSIRTREGTARFPSIDDWIHTDVNGWTLAGMLDDDQYRRLLEAARVELAGFAADDGSVRFAAPAHIVTMRAR
ncbi:MAG: class I SAM-dependent methyltransferase [Proteobacteria bacterium]|nr:MAG: class I SAM-dependent methyltransferase [Pseudomonadota bacterium]